jgi:hypothetical protein
MACFSEWVNYAATGTAVIGSAGAIIGLPATGVGVLVEGAAIVAFIGSAAAHILAGYQLGTCLGNNGQTEEQRQIEERTRALEREVERLRQLVE